MLSLVTAPATTPVSLDEAKAHLRVDSSDDDAVIEGLIAAATSHLDGWSGVLGRALITQQWRMDLRCWDFPMRLPLGPVQSVDSIDYWDASNAEAEYPSSAYELRGALVELADGANWPTIYNRADAVRVTFTAGYGDDPADVPAAIRQAILLLVGHWYAAREAAGTRLTEMPFGVAALLAPFRNAGV